MAQACLDTGTHYLDITGEIDVFERLRGLAGEAVAAGVVLLPGIGFDVVPTDCLAVAVCAALPGSSALDLAFLPDSGPSAGTARTAVALLRAGGRARINGAITRVPVNWKSLRAEFPSGPRTVRAVPWGDVSTAYYSTGIANITTYTALPPGGAAMAAVLRLSPVAAAAAALAGRVRGPGETRRAGGRAEVWARASLGSRTATGTLTTPNPYDLTADSVVRAAIRLSAPESGVAPGVHTPATAFGAGYVTELDGVVAGPVQVSG
jgi:short subunit dehydrogenase-like uncharacterized protein